MPYSGVDLNTLIESLSRFSPNEIPPLDLPHFTPVRSFSEFGILMDTHLRTYYSVFHAYLKHHEQLYDFIYPWQQKMRYRASQLTDSILAYHHIPHGELRTREEEEDRFWAMEAVERGEDPELPDALDLQESGYDPAFVIQTLDDIQHPVQNMILRRYLYPYFPLPADDDDCPF